MGKGQLSIDYTSGALLFFVSMIFVVSGALSIVPEFQSIASTNSMEVSGWSISTMLLNEPGHWRSAQGGGLDWHTQIDSPGRITAIGLASPEGDLSREKIRALATLSRTDYTYLKTELLATEKDFNIVFHEFATVDTGRTFTKQEDARTTDPPAAFQNQFTPPFEPTSYDEADPTVHYGSIRINGEAKYFLVTSQAGLYSQVYYSDSWNFSDATNLSIPQNSRSILMFNGRRYELAAGDAGVLMGDGQIVVMERVIARLGQQPPEAQQRVTHITRYANIDERMVKMEMDIWG
ncbi:MAG: hypothetical protein SVU32_03615 [Candidatus Nanohaloarchaea archaeon]|nr:hypothetical protein [Candidatus Nanohaloarchaea archaeon]